MKKCKCKCGKKVCLWVVLGLLIACCSVFNYIHRRVIRAAVKKEPMPDCPHWLPPFVKDKLGI
ncbi:MAG: hypothetical protein IJH47_10325 [Oscillospiraceae bacterium]|nr:hypothetical protein [Oscillospiraceae bacterium]